MATQPHDIWLVTIIESTNFVLAFSPMRTVFSKKINQDLFVAKNKGIPSTILPTKIHGRRFPGSSPRCM